MTLKEKFYPYCDNEYSEKWASAENCEDVAEDFAIEFGKWLNNQVINSSGKHHNLLGSSKITQLLPIFKKEKGL